MDQQEIYEKVLVFNAFIIFILTMYSGNTTIILRSGITIDLSFEIFIIKKSKIDVDKSNSTFLIIYEHMNNL